MFDRMHDGWGWGMHAGWWVFLVLLAVLIVLAVWAISRNAGTGRRAGPPKETPLERLQRRYAEGEISTEEYEERKSRLE